MNIIFDIGDVLLEWRVDLMFSHLPDPVDQERIMKYLVEHEDWLEMDRGHMDLETAIDRTVERSGIARESVVELMASIPGSLVPMPGTIALLNEIDREKHRLFCLSNLHEHVWNDIKDVFDLWDRFEDIVVSCFTGYIKPEREIYEYVLNTNGLKPEDTIFIDDRPVNIAGAEDVGIQGLLFEDADDCRAKLWPLLS